MSSGTGSPRRPALAALAAVLWLATLVAAPPARASDTASGSTYLDAVFELFLARSPTDRESERWHASVDWGSLARLTAALSRSPEWATGAVAELYVDVLRRPADDDGVRYWASRVSAGWQLEAVAAALYGSDEYFTTHGASDGGFVDALYEQLLQRSAEPEGRRHWMDTLAAGVERATVAGAFLHSIESRRARVDRTFRQVLGRRADPSGREYWADALTRIGDVGLAAQLAASDEFYERATGTARPDVERAPVTDLAVFATVGAVPLHHPAARVERVGFHESNHDGAQQQAVATSAIRPVTMDTRYRSTGSRTAADLVVPPEEVIVSPVTGTVLRSGTYVLYCEYRDDFAVIEPDAHPGWEVVVLHIDGVQVGPGDRVEAGRTPVAPRATRLPFSSQVDRWTAQPAWPHVHIEVRDPAIPDRPSGGC